MYCFLLVNILSIVLVIFTLFLLVTISFFFPHNNLSFLFIFSLTKTQNNPAQHSQRTIKVTGHRKLSVFGSKLKSIMSKGFQQSLVIFEDKVGSSFTRPEAGCPAGAAMF